VVGGETNVLAGLQCFHMLPSLLRPRAKVLISVDIPGHSELAVSRREEEGDEAQFSHDSRSARATVQLNINDGEPYLDNYSNSYSPRPVLPTFNK